jgi:hypothetical protein
MRKTVPDAGRESVTFPAGFASVEGIASTGSPEYAVFTVRDEG